jgi:hypothetical protein
VGSRGLALIVASALAGAGAVASCTIDIPDVVDASADAPNDTPSSDAPIVAGDGGVLPKCEAGACGAPAGFAPVLFALDRNTGCPTGTISHDQASDPVADASACPCDCTVVDPPTCVPHVLVHKVDALEAGVCGATSSLQIEVDGGCNAPSVNALLAGHWSVAPFAPVDAGACTSNPQPATSALASTPSRMCVDPSCGTCAAPPGFRVCYAAPGAVACPKGTTAHAAGSSVSLACSQCTACGLTVTCGGAIQFFSDNACQTPLGNTVPVNGSCTSTGGAAQTLGAIVYEGGLATETCKPGNATPAPQLAGPLTICCP